MNKIITALAICIVAINSYAALVISNVAPTSITTTSMVFNATVVSTNGTGTNPIVMLFYGTVDYTTNANSWAYSNVYGVAGVGNISTQITGLSASHKYYFAWRAVEGATTFWATPSLSAWTKASSPTSTPAVVTISVQTDTNAVLKAPVNFFSANSNLLIAALGPQGDSNAVWGNITGTLSSQTDLQSAIDGKASTGAVAAISSDFGAHTNNEAADIQHLTAAQVENLTNSLPGRIGAIEASTDKWDTASSDASSATNAIAEHIADNANPHGVTASQSGAVATNDTTYTDTVAKAASALQTESDPIWSGVSNDVQLNFTALKGRTNYWNAAITGATIAAGSLDDVSIANGVANITWNTNAAGGGGVGTITNIISSDTSVAVSESGGPQPDLSITDYVAGVVSDYVLTNDPAYLAIETERIALQDGINIAWRVEGTNVYPDLDGAITNQIEALKAATNNLNARYPVLEGSANVHVSLTATGQVLSVDAGAVDYGITDSTAYRGDWGNSVSGRVDVIETNYYQLQDGISVSNMAYAASTNAEAVRIIATNAQAVANAALPKSATNALAVTALQITGGAPTNGAVWVATNNLGEGKWSKPCAFRAVLSANCELYNYTESNVTWGSEIFDIGNNFNGTSFIAPVNGVYRFSTYSYWTRSSGVAGYVQCQIAVNDATKIGNVYCFWTDGGSAKGGNIFIDSGAYYLTNGANVKIIASGISGTTNILNTGILNYFTGELIKELP